nr:hypothetical protein [Tanacetum cinerariifolium]
MATSTQTLIEAFVAGSPPFLLPPTSPAYDQAPLGHRKAMIRMSDDILEEDMLPRRRFSAKDLAVTQMMRIHVLKAIAQTDMMDDVGSSYDDIQVEYDDEDPKEDPSEEYEPEDDDEDPEEDPNEEHEPPSKGSDETEPFEEDKTAVTPPPPRHRGARISVRPQTPMAASTQALINAFAAGSPPFPLSLTNPAHDQAPLGHRTVMIRMRDEIAKEDIPPQR